MLCKNDANKYWNWKSFYFTVTGELFPLSYLNVILENILYMLYFKMVLLCKWQAFLEGRYSSCIHRDSLQYGNYGYFFRFKENKKASINTESWNSLWLFVSFNVPSSFQIYKCPGGKLVVSQLTEMKNESLFSYCSLVSSLRWFTQRFHSCQSAKPHVVGCTNDNWISVCEDFGFRKLYAFSV